MGRFRADLATAQRELGEAQGKAERAETLRREVAEYLLDVETERDEAIKQRDAAKQVIACMKGLDRAHREAIQQAESERDLAVAQVAKLRDALHAVETNEFAQELRDRIALKEAADAAQAIIIERGTFEAQVAQMREALESVDGVIRESRGVDGWYLNGGIATWGELGLDSEVANALSATPTQAEQRYKAAVAVAEAAPKRDELRHLYWETCKTCEHSCVNEGQWKQCELKQRLDVAEKVYDDALAAYASAKGEKK